MYEHTVIKEMPPEDIIPGNVGEDIAKQIINTLSENKLSISQTRCLFNHILTQFERYMPVTNHINQQDNN